MTLAKAMLKTKRSRKKHPFFNFAEILLSLIHTSFTNCKSMGVKFARDINNSLIRGVVADQNSSSNRLIQLSASFVTGKSTDIRHFVKPLLSKNIG